MPIRTEVAKRSSGNSEEHERNTWVREQFELWLAAEAMQQPRSVSDRLKLFDDFRARLERGDIEMVALRNAAAAAEKASPSEQPMGRTE